MLCVLANAGGGAAAGAGLGLLGDLGFSGLSALTPQPFQVELVGHGHPAIQLTRVPLLVQIISLDLDREVAGHRGQPHRLRASTTAECDTVLSCHHARQACLDRNDQRGPLRRFGVLLGGGAGFLVRRLRVRRVRPPPSIHFLAVCGVLQTHREPQDVFPTPRLVRDLAGALALEAVLDHKLEELGQGHAARRQPAGAHRGPLGFPQQVQEMLQEFSCVLLPAARELRVASADQPPEHRRRQRVYRPTGLL
mmetsp:Transcript_102674/g.314042  ORF Transcript_102674/g.314042 Transcript_102674/m.314042 type:complete len:251 (-) Transcript_102674:1339-2091(-)